MMIWYGPVNTVQQSQLHKYSQTLFAHPVNYNPLAPLSMIIIIINISIHLKVFFIEFAPIKMTFLFLVLAIPH